MTIETKKTHQKAGVKRPNFQSGFSIIELTIILAIFAFFAVNLLVTDETSKTFKKYDDTLDKMEVIKEALDKYVVEFGHYPCPADGNLPINAGGNLALGDSTWTSLTLATGAADCRNANFVANTLDTAYLPALPYTPPPYNVDDLSQHIGVFVGVVPTRDLGLPMDYMIDSFGNRLTYAVRKELTTTLSFALSTNADPTTGAAPSWPFGAASNITLQFVNSAGSIANNAAYLVVSHGANGYGAYPYERGIPKASGSYGATRIFPPNAVGGAWNCANSHDPLTNPIGTYSAGELENHHLCQEIATLATTASLNKVGGVFNAKFFTANAPELPPAGSTSILAYDDLIVGNNQITHDLSSTALPHTDGSQPLIKFYEDPNGTDGGGKSPDQFLGLAAWFDAQECSTILDAAATPTNVCNASGTVNVSLWHEKMSISNNYYKNHVPQENVYGSIGKTRAPANQPDYNSATNTINNFPALYFNGVANTFIFDGPLINPAYPSPGTSDPSFGSFSNILDTMTIFAVVQFPNPVSENSYQAIFGRTNLFSRTNWKSTIPKGYSIFAFNPSTPDWGSTGSPPTQIGFGIGDGTTGFQTAAGVPDQTNIVSGINITPGSPQIIVATYNGTSGDLASIYSSCTSAESKNVGSISHSDEAILPTGLGNVDRSAGIGIGAMTLRPNPANDGKFEGLIGEIIFYERALTDYEREAVTRYLEEKWGFPTSGCDPNGKRPNIGDAYPGGTEPVIINAHNSNSLSGVGCAGKVLLGAAAAAPTDCCSNAYNSTTCCMNPYQLHIEKCKSNSDCCNGGACSAFGYCYTHDPANPQSMNPSY